MPLEPLRRRCATSFFSCDRVAEGHFSRDAHTTSIIEPFRLGQDQNATPTDLDESFEAKELEAQSLMTTASGSPHRAPILSVLSHGTPQHPDPLKPTRDLRTSSKRFERPNYLRIFLHAAFCCIAYPVLFAGTIAAKDRSLFWARVIVGLWCGAVGIVIGWSLVAFATKYTEAASEYIPGAVFFAPCGCPTRR
jgi:hypothetical protein